MTPSDDELEKRRKAMSKAKWYKEMMLDQKKRYAKIDKVLKRIEGYLKEKDSK